MPTSRSSKPNILITMGDPAGVGPEVTLKALASRDVSGLANFLLIGDGFVLNKIRLQSCPEVKIPVLDLANVPKKNFYFGRARPSSGKASMQYIDAALKLIKSARIDGIVTGPVCKASVRASGYPDFEGHTEYLADRARVKDFAMMFVGPALKIVLVTRHMPMRKVPSSLSVSAIYKTIAITDKYLKVFFKMKNPRIGVAGLNPHAGESGLFGDEEKRLIIPAIRKASRNIRYLSGPIPPDVIFYEAINNKFDAVISMYHDQALIPFKMLYFKSGVNLTLGLPFVRTSPDHGTAFDIAGKGIADPASMIEAIRLVCRLARR